MTALVSLDLTEDQLRALRAYATRRRANVTASCLRDARTALYRHDLIRDCDHRESPMFIAVTERGLQVLAEADRPVQLELFALAGGAR